MNACKAVNKFYKPLKCMHPQLQKPPEAAPEVLDVQTERLLKVPRVWGARGTPRP